MAEPESSSNVECSIPVGCDGDGPLRSAGPAAALLLVVGEPVNSGQRDLILERITSDLLKWDVQAAGCDLLKILDNLCCRKVDTSRNEKGEVLINDTYDGHSSIDILVNPRIDTLYSHVHKFLLHSSRYRRLVYSGVVLAGAWMIQDGSFAPSALVELVKTADVVDSFAKLGKSAHLDICATGDGWNEKLVNGLGSSISVRLNPETGDENVNREEMSRIVESLISSSFRPYSSVDELLASLDAAGPVAVISRPSLDIFPAGQGCSSIFSIEGFNLLVDGGYCRATCAWERIRFLDRIDAMVISQIRPDNILGTVSMLERKSHSVDDGQRLPDIGVVYCNIGRNVDAPSGHENPLDETKLLLHSSDIAHKIYEYLHKLGISPSHCHTHDGPHKPINLYHKIGQGSLDLHIICPTLDPVAALHGKHSEDHTTGITSVVVWQPAKAGAAAVRVLFVDSVSQAKLFEGLDRLKAEKIFQSWSGKTSEVGAGDKRGMHPPAGFTKGGVGVAKATGQEKKPVGKQLTVGGHEGGDSARGSAESRPQSTAAKQLLGKDAKKVVTETKDVKKLPSGRPDSNAAKLSTTASVDMKNGKKETGADAKEGKKDPRKQPSADSRKHFGGALADKDSKATGDEAEHNVEVKLSETKKPSMTKAAGDAAAKPAAKKPTVESKKPSVPAPTASAKEPKKSTGKPDDAKKASSSLAVTKRVAAEGKSALNATMDDMSAPPSLTSTPKREKGATSTSGKKMTPKATPKTVADPMQPGHEVPPASVEVEGQPQEDVAETHHEAEPVEAIPEQTDSEPAEYAINTESAQEGDGEIKTEEELKYQPEGVCDNQTEAANADHVHDYNETSANGQEEPQPLADTNAEPHTDEPESLPQPNGNETTPFDPTQQWGAPDNLPMPAPINGDEEGNGGVSVEAIAVSVEDPANVEASAAALDTATNNNEGENGTKALTDESSGTTATATKQGADKKAGCNNKQAADGKTGKAGTTGVAVKKGRSSVLPGELQPPARSESNPMLSHSKPPANSAGAGRKSVATSGAANASTVKTHAVTNPFYVDVTYIPNHGDGKHIDVNFFHRVRAHTYVLSGARADVSAISKLIEAKRNWDSATDAEVTVIPTYDTADLLTWVSRNHDELQNAKVVIAPSASRCHIQMPGYDSNYPCYRVEF